MTEFLSQFADHAFTMPTTVWSVLLILYWNLSVSAGLDFGQPARVVAYDPAGESFLIEPLSAAENA